MYRNYCKMKFIVIICSKYKLVAVFPHAKVGPLTVFFFSTHMWYKWHRYFVLQNIWSLWFILLTYSCCNISAGTTNCQLYSTSFYCKWYVGIILSGSICQKPPNSITNSRRELARLTRLTSYSKLRFNLKSTNVLTYRCFRVSYDRLRISALRCFA